MSEDRKLTGKPIMFATDTKTLKWEMDEDGSHRINDAADGGGEWASYTSPCVSKCGGFICFTQYYDGYFPVETILQITPLKKMD